MPAPAPPPGPAPAPALAPAPAALADLAASWFMPLPPPPHGRPAAAAPAKLSSPLRPSDAHLPDLDSPTPGGSDARASSGSEFVPESPLGPGTGSVAPPAASSLARIDGRLVARHYCSTSVERSSSPPAATSRPTPGASSRSATGAGREADKADMTGGWRLVKSRRGPRHPALEPQAFMPPPLPLWLKGRCCRCLAPGHKALLCREPIRCTRCLENGHRARGCKNRWRPLSSLPCLSFIPPPPLPRSSPDAPLAQEPKFGAGRGWPLPKPAPAPLLLPQPPAPPLLLDTATTTMPRLGDAALRPEEDFVVVPATPEMQAEAALLSTNAAVAWFEGAREDVPCNTVAAAFAATFGFRQEDVSVVRHYPEQYLVWFLYQHNCADAVDRGNFLVGNSRLFVRGWRLEAHADNKDMLYHVRLCLEGIPMHGWNNYIALFVIGRGCSLDYIEQRSVRRDDTRDLSLWAWTSDPNHIPKVKWLTLPARGHRCRGRRGLRHRVLVHLDLLEDHTKAKDDDDNPPPAEIQEYTWYRRCVDGTVGRGECRAAQGRDERRPPRREDEDDRDGRRGRGAPRPREGWGARIRRSLSRGATDRQRTEGQDRSRDRCGGRRRSDAPEMAGLAPAPASVAPATVILGSGSTSAEETRALELLPVHGRSPARQVSPRAVRRRAQEALTPPASPPLSPTPVLPHQLLSKRDDPRASTISLAAQNPAVTHLCSPTVLLLPLSPARPPGFESSPTPPLVSSGPVRRTPSPVQRRRAAADIQPACVGQAVLFDERPEPILPSPASTPPRPPAARRKTLAGVTISRSAAGLSLHKTCVKNKAPGRAKEAPATKAAELLVCRSLGIVKNGEDVTSAALDAFAEKFKDTLPPEVISSMRELFKLDDVQDAGVEDALIQHGGAGAIDLDGPEDAAGALLAAI
ncbi:hypothetical protein ACQJBY_026642 [Aegilops geniculata]